MTEDAELLRRYAEEKSEKAFAELVQRRIGLVYSVALRHTHDAQRAEEVTQAVFTALARKARALAQRPVLVGWLYRSTQFAASDAVRAERRRQVREQEAHTMQQITREGAEPDWEKLQPVLDEVLNDLPESDRDAVLLRFFDQQPFAEIRRKLSLSENAARMRVERALEKLHAHLGRRGVTSTTAALGIAIAHQAGVAAPVGLGVTVTASAVAGTGTAAGMIATFMSMTKIQIAVAGAVAVAGTVGFMRQAETNDVLRAEAAALQQENAGIASLRSENLRLARTARDVETLRTASSEIPRLEEEKASLRPPARVAPPSVVAAPPASTSWPNALPIVAMNQLDQIPQPLYRADPQYPFEMRRTGTNGEVVVGLVVDPAGNVQDVLAVRSTHPDFEAAALAAVKKWKFKPGIKAGEGVNVRMQIPIVFTLAPESESRAVRTADWF